MAGAGVCRRCDAVGAVKTAEVAGARGCSTAEYCKGEEECHRYCNGVNTGVFASKYNFGISNSRYESARGPIATCFKCKSA